MINLRSAWRLVARPGRTGLLLVQWLFPSRWPPNDSKFLLSAGSIILASNDTLVSGTQEINSNRAPMNAQAAPVCQGVRALYALLWYLQLVKRTAGRHGSGYGFGPIYILPAIVARRRVQPDQVTITI
jgi:hypothetical protein